MLSIGITVWNAPEYALIQNGESLAYVRDQLGHASIKMTVDVYGHLVPGANRAAVNKLPGLQPSTPTMQAVAAH